LTTALQKSAKNIFQNGTGKGCEPLAGIAGFLYIYKYEKLSTKKKYKYTVDKQSPAAKVRVVRRV